MPFQKRRMGNDRMSMNIAEPSNLFYPIIILIILIIFFFFIGFFFPKIGETSEKDSKK
jgi:hypothetical protein